MTSSCTVASVLCYNGRWWSKGFPADSGKTFMGELHMLCNSLQHFGQVSLSVSSTCARSLVNHSHLAFGNLQLIDHRCFISLFPALSKQLSEYLAFHLHLPTLMLLFLSMPLTLHNNCLMMIASMYIAVLTVWLDLSYLGLFTAVVLFPVFQSHKMDSFALSTSKEKILCLSWVSLH